MAKKYMFRGNDGTSESAQEIGEAIEDIRKRHPDGKVPAEWLVEEAYEEDHPAHGHFTWEDDSAAHNWRCQQARMLIATIVTPIKRGNKQVPVRAFVSLSGSRFENDGGYDSIERVLADPKKSQELLSDAVDELRRVLDKYSNFDELSPVFRAMGRVMKQIHIDQLDPKKQPKRIARKKAA